MNKKIRKTSPNRDEKGVHVYAASNVLLEALQHAGERRDSYCVLDLKGGMKNSSSTRKSLSLPYHATWAHCTSECLRTFFRFQTG